MKTRIGILLFVFFSATGLLARADFYDSDSNKEQAQIRQIEDQQKEEERGFHHDDLQRAKELIFKQLEVITGDEETRYIIVPGDTLSVAFNDRNTKSGALYKVSKDGEIFMPLVNAIKVVGLNRQDARALISNRLSEYIRNPSVEITVNASGRVMVLGEVNLPGLYNMQPNLTAMEAIMKAGGYNKDSASIKGVILVRGAGKDATAMRLNLHKMITKADRSDDVILKPGDMLYVPKTLISDLTKFKDEVYKWVSLYYSYGRIPASPPVDPNQPVLYK